MSFEYRVVVSGGECAVHEVFYDDDARPNSCTRALSPSVDSVESLRHELRLMLEALDKSSLRYDDIGAGDPAR